MINKYPPRYHQLLRLSSGVWTIARRILSLKNTKHQDILAGYLKIAQHNLRSACTMCRHAYLLQSLLDVFQWSLNQQHYYQNYLLSFSGGLGWLSLKCPAKTQDGSTCVKNVFASLVKKWSTIQGKNLLLRSKFFPCRVDPFS